MSPSGTVRLTHVFLIKGKPLNSPLWMFCVDRQPRYILLMYLVSRQVLYLSEFSCCITQMKSEIDGAFALSLRSEWVYTSGVECKGDCLKDYKMTLRFLCCSALFLPPPPPSPFTELVSGEARFTPSAVSPPAERCDRNCCSVSAPRYLQVHLLWCRSQRYFHSFSYRWRFHTHL